MKNLPPPISALRATIQLHPWLGYRIQYETRDRHHRAAILRPCHRRSIDDMGWAHRFVLAFDVLQLISYFLRTGQHTHTHTHTTGGQSKTKHGDVDDKYGQQWSRTLNSSFELEAAVQTKPM